MTPEKEENINSLCKKYFTPELCDESVTESKMSLKGKIYAQLLKYGDWICDKYYSSEGGSQFFCEIVIDIIEACWKNWEKLPEERSYSSYFYSAVKNKILECYKKERINMNAQSLDVSIDSNEADSETTFHERIEDKNTNVDGYLEKKDFLERTEQYLKSIDIWFKKRKRDDWNKAMITAELYEGLHLYFDYFPERKLSRFEFIDDTIYNLLQPPKNKELALILNRDEGQLSRARSTFREQIASIYNLLQE